ncbi:MAG TPA: zf-HC2 domain-containing protein [Actinomycetota bacterium]|nr:zf-HC2 domain-containing protein [Actinomycetota bacterium]
MTHPEDQLAGYVDGSLDRDERAVVDAHLATCSNCRDELAAATVARAALASLPRSVATPPAVGRAAIEGARRSDRAVTRPVAAPDHPRWSRWAGAAAGAAAVVLALAVAIPSLSGGDGDRAAELAAPGVGGGAQATDAIGLAEVERIAGNLGPADLPALADPILAEVEDGTRELEAGAVADQPGTQDDQGAAPSGDAASEAAALGTTAATCLRTAFPALTTEPLRIARLRFEGTPAYGGVFYVPGGTETEFGTFEADVLQVVVASRGDCSLLGTAPVRV